MFFFFFLLRFFSCSKTPGKFEKSPLQNLPTSSNFLSDNAEKYVQNRYKYHCQANVFHRESKI